MRNDERVLWSHANLECVMTSCCSGAELQLRRVGAVEDGDNDAILLRELYPMKSDLYERARELEKRHREGPVESPDCAGV
jgi:hypothetical protein